MTAKAEDPKPFIGKRIKSIKLKGKKNDEEIVLYFDDGTFLSIYALAEEDGEEAFLIFDTQVEML